MAGGSKKIDVKRWHHWDGEYDPRQMVRDVAKSIPGDELGTARIPNDRNPLRVPIVFEGQMYELPEKFPASSKILPRLYTRDSLAGRWKLLVDHVSPIQLIWGELDTKNNRSGVWRFIPRPSYMNVQQIRDEIREVGNPNMMRHLKSSPDLLDWYVRILWMGKLYARYSVLAKREASFIWRTVDDLEIELESAMRLLCDATTSIEPNPTRRVTTATVLSIMPPAVFSLQENLMEKVASVLVNLSEHIHPYLSWGGVNALTILAERNRLEHPFLVDEASRMIIKAMVNLQTHDWVREAHQKLLNPRGVSEISLGGVMATMSDYQEMMISLIGGFERMNEYLSEDSPVRGMGIDILEEVSQHARTSEVQRVAEDALYGFGVMRRADSAQPPDLFQARAYAGPLDLSSLTSVLQVPVLGVMKG